LGFVEGGGDFVAEVAGGGAGTGSERGPDVDPEGVFDVAVEGSGAVFQAVFGLCFVPWSVCAAAVHCGVADDGGHETCAHALGDVVDEAADAGDARAEAFDEVFSHVDVVDGGDDADDVGVDGELLAEAGASVVDVDDAGDHDEVAVEDDEEVGGLPWAECDADHDVAHGGADLAEGAGVNGFE